MQRLAFIRYLYTQGMEQSRRAETLSSVAVLSWHDSVELFLHLSAERRDIDLKPRGKLEFNEYFGQINAKIAPERLAHQSSMSRLNDTRVSLKHRGVLPSNSSIEQLRADVTRFFEDNTPLIFRIEFEAVSLADLVAYPMTRQSLRDAVLALEDERIEDAGIAIGMAFAQLMVEHERQAGRGFAGHPPFRFLPPFITPPSMRRRTIPDQDQVAFEQDLVTSLESMEGALRLLSLGIDYRRYAKFRYYMPAVRHIPGSDRFVVQIMQGMASKPNWPPSPQTCRSCLDFVIETALTLQEFDRYLDAE
jgi:hypothetical protein